jgi:hypothetical protein
MGTIFRRAIFLKSNALRLKFGLACCLVMAESNWVQGLERGGIHC